MRRAALPLIGTILIACAPLSAPSPATPSMPLAQPVDFPTSPSAAAPPAAPAGAGSYAPASATSGSPVPQQSPPAIDGDELTIETEGPLTNTEEGVLRTVALCVRAASEKGAKSTRPLNVDLTVNPNGRVTDVQLGAGYHPDAAKCVRNDLLMKLAYPPRPYGGDQFFSYPIVEVTEEK